jgi:hypothetical protein
MPEIVTGMQKMGLSTSILALCTSPMTSCPGCLARKTLLMRPCPQGMCPWLVHFLCRTAFTPRCTEAEGRRHGITTHCTECEACVTSYALPRS